MYYQHIQEYYLTTILHRVVADSTLQCWWIWLLQDCCTLCLCYIIFHEVVAPYKRLQSLWPILIQHVFSYFISFCKIKIRKTTTNENNNFLDIVYLSYSWHIENLINTCMCIGDNNLCIHWRLIKTGKPRTQNKWYSFLHNTKLHPYLQWINNC